MRSPTLVISTVVLALAASNLCAGETIINKELGFQFTVPDGFVEHPELAKGMIYFFASRPGGDHEDGLCFSITRIHGAIGREKPELPKKVLPGSESGAIIEKWKDFDIHGFREVDQLFGTKSLSFTAQIPLTPEAIAVTVTGGPDQEAELHAVLQSILASLDGKTNWLITEQHGERFGRGILPFVVGLVAVVIIVVLIIRYDRKSRNARGGVEEADCEDRDEIDDKRPPSSRL